jgi:hypothetical protein
MKMDRCGKGSRSWLCPHVHTMGTALDPASGESASERGA